MKSQLLLKSNFFMSILPFFKSFILTFEQKEMLIHRRHRSLIENFYAFLGCFMTFELINNTSYNKLNLIDVASNVQSFFKQSFSLHMLLLQFLFKTNVH